MTSQTVRLVEPEKLHSPHLVLRCRVAGDAGALDSVIVKQNTATEFTASEEGAPSHRLLNEWAALSFLSSSGEGPWPRLLVASSEHSFVVIEDLGVHPAVLDVLSMGGEASAVRSLESLGSTLGAMHAVGHGRLRDFLDAQSKIGAASPRCDSNIDVRDEVDSLQACFDFFGMTAPATFWHEIDRLETAIHTPGLFHTVIHGDAGPQNFIWTREGARLLDFEFVTPGHGFLDLVSARLGFPHSEEGQTLPTAAVDALEHAYRSALVTSVPHLDDDSLFRGALVDACAHWALVRWAASWRRLFGDELLALPDEQLQLRRSQTFTVYERFIATAEGSPHRLQIALAVEEFIRVLRHRHPELASTPIYPAFSSQTP